MKKRLIALLSLSTVILAGCYDDSNLRERINQNDAKIEQIVKELDGIRADVRKANSNYEGLNQILLALQTEKFIKDVTDVKDGGKVIGYTITFSDNKTITIYNGEKGDPGDPGNPGEPGKAPVISVTNIDGVYYWTVDGEVLKDPATGEAIRASGSDGAPGDPGDPGDPGEPGKTPQIRISDDGANWEIRWGDDEEWTVVGPATSGGGTPSVDPLFKSVDETATGVVFTLTDGYKIVIPLEVEFSIQVDNSKSYDVVAGATTEIPYTVAGGDSSTEVDAIAGGLWYAEVEGAEEGVVKVTAPKTDPGKGKVLVYAANGKGKSDIKTLVFEGGTLTVTAPTTEVPVDGGVVNVDVVTNVEYEVVIDDESAWVANTTTKAGALRTDKLEFTVAANTTPSARTADIQLVDEGGATIQSFAISQASGTYTEPAFEDNNFKTYILNYFDLNEDGKISAEEAGKITAISYSESSHGAVSSFKGVEAFYNLTSFKFECPSYGTVASTVESIDLSKNSKLQTITISDKNLKTLNVSGLTQVTSISAGNTGITALDLGTMTKLTSLVAYNSGLTSLDLSKNTKLTSVAVYGSPLTSLDVTGLTELTTLSAGCSGITSLDVTKNTKLTSLSVDNIAASSIDLSALTELKTFSASSSQLTVIDLSNSPALTSVTCNSATKVKLIDVSKATKLTSLMAMSCSALEEIRYAKGVSTSSWWYPSGHWNEDETYTATKMTEVDVETVEIDDYAAEIVDPTLKKYVLRHYDADGDGKIGAEEVASVTEIDVEDYGITSLEGINYFTALKTLKASGNKVESLNIPDLAALEVLDLSGNKLAGSISLSGCKALKELNLKDNSLTGVTTPTSVVTVDLSNNKLTSYTSQYCYSLTSLNVENNALTSLTVYYDTALLDLKAANNKLSSVQFWSCSALKSADFNNNPLTSIGSSFPKNLETLLLQGNKLNSVNIASFVNSLKKLDVTGGTLKVLFIGAGNSIPEGVLVGGDDVTILAITNPTVSLVTNQYSSIASATVSGAGTTNSVTVNYATSTTAYVVPAGETLTLTTKGNRKELAFLALGVNGTPKVTVARADGGKVYVKGDSSYCSENPFVTRENSWAATDQVNLVVDGDGDRARYFFGPADYSSSSGLKDGDTVTLKVEGSSGESVIFLGVNFSAYRYDEQ